MAQNELSDPRVDEIIKALDAKKIALGSKVAVKKLREKKVKKIFLSANIASQMKEDIEYYASLVGVSVEQLTMTNEELSIVCKKPFLINIISIVA